MIQISELSEPRDNMTNSTYSSARHHPRELDSTNLFYIFNFLSGLNIK